MKKCKIVAVLVAVFVSLGISPNILAQARSFEILEILQTEKRVESRVEPKDNAQVGKVYEPGELLLIVEGGNDNWKAVAYQGNVYYVKKTDAAEAKSPAMNVEIEVENQADGKVENTTKEIVFDEGFKEELKAEMEIATHESKAYVESYTRHQEETGQKRIWGAIIGILVAAIFGVSIYSYVSGKTEKDKKIKK